ncbi:MAG: hypothetical protein HC878_03615 [Leptolyngbyaceae cyanobacterium SL_5_14]|nr:hypothetical protein [Leptolyngbyaceae cyanobacterium SL_5_14]NJO66149.1 hypothetical protein [Leptolyngbyaceae cyanobacterium RM1_405_57]
MAFQDSFAYYGGKYQKLHRDRAEIATKIRAYLGLGFYISVYAIRFEVWEKVVWVYVPGFRPTFISRTAVGV